MTNNSNNSDFQSDDEWETYLAVFLEESDEDLETLMQCLLRLEQSPDDAESLNEAFRLLHTHKGSAGLMGFEGISQLAHQLENRFDHYREGKERLDNRRVTILLKCVDFLKAFNAALRNGQDPVEDSTDLLKQLSEVESSDHSGVEATGLSSFSEALLQTIHGGYQVAVEFEEGLQLADMKARLIIARLANIGEIIATEPDVDSIQSIDGLTRFSLVVLTDQAPDKVQEIANVDGVKSIHLQGGQESENGHNAGQVPSAVGDEEKGNDDPKDVGEVPLTNASADKPHKFPEESESENLKTETPTQSDRNVSESVRVGIDRLDKLMNLTGEIVMTQARLNQLVSALNYSFRSTGMIVDSDDSGSQLKINLDRLKSYLSQRPEGLNGCEELLQRLTHDFEAVDQRFEKWDASKKQLVLVAETAEQLNRLSDNLQQSVLDTRMVPVAPLFNRFRRVIRDLAEERNKQVKLEIKGEKTELDKRMIDELGDPLLHLIRNSIDHGMETPEERLGLGKSGIGTVTLEASHRGNNVLISISDDGRGLDLERIRQRAISRKLVTDVDIHGLSDEQIIDFIWHPGFSTSEQVTDISGRGVGMDVVKSRISELNGSVEVVTHRNEGATFTLRLPLTLAIIRSLLVRFQDTHFSIPIEDVIETAAIDPKQIQMVYGREMIEIRSEVIPLIRFEETFHWKSEIAAKFHDKSKDDVTILRVVIVKAKGHVSGIIVDELFGSADVVIKSLADNYENIKGLSGASILGDGSICLMLDTSEVIKMASYRQLEN